jgi:hypothetical protein
VLISTLQESQQEDSHHAATSSESTGARSCHSASASATSLERDRPWRDAPGWRARAPRGTRRRGPSKPPDRDPRGTRRWNPTPPWRPRAAATRTQPSRRRRGRPRGGGGGLLPCCILFSFSKTKTRRDEERRWPRRHHHCSPSWAVPLGGSGSGATASTMGRGGGSTSNVHMEAVLSGLPSPFYCVGQYRTLVQCMEEVNAG